MLIAYALVCPCYVPNAYMCSMQHGVLKQHYAAARTRLCVSTVVTVRASTATKSKRPALALICLVPIGPCTWWACLLHSFCIVLIVWWQSCCG